MWIGRQKNNNDNKTGGIKWSNEPIKALGVYFGNNKYKCNNLNWQTKISKCKEIVKNWLKRNILWKSTNNKILINS